MKGTIDSTGARSQTCGSSALGLDALEELVAEAHRAMQSTEPIVCRHLALLADRFDQSPEDFPGGLYETIKREFRMGERAARERVRIGRALRALPSIERAFASSALAYARVRDVTRVAKPDDEASWLDLARAMSTREFDVRIARAELEALSTAEAVAPTVRAPAVRA